MSAVVEMREVGGVFVVGLSPPDPDRPERRFTDRKAAWSAACGLSLTTRCPKRDLTGG